MKHALTLAYVCILLAGCSSLPRSNPGAASGATTESRPGAVQAPLGMTASPPNLPVTSGGSARPAGWHTLSSAQLGVAIDYPEGWRISDQADGVSFLSPQGEKIQLQSLVRGSSGPSPTSGTEQCAALVNSYGVDVNACVEPGSDRYSAEFALPGTDNPARPLVLSTTDKSALEVYQQMLESLRPLQ